MIGATHEALFERAVGAANGPNTSAVFAGHEPATTAPPVCLGTPGGGKDGVQVNVPNTSNLPVAAIEPEYLLGVEDDALVASRGGTRAARAR